MFRCVCVCVCGNQPMNLTKKLIFYLFYSRKETCDSCLDVVICVLRIMFKFLLYLRMNEFQMKIYFLVFMLSLFVVWQYLWLLCILYLVSSSFFSSPLIHSMTEVVTFIIYHFFLVFFIVVAQKLSAINCVIKHSY